MRDRTSHSAPTPSKRPIGAPHAAVVLSLGAALTGGDWDGFEGTAIRGLDYGERLQLLRSAIAASLPFAPDDAFEIIAGAVDSLAAGEPRPWFLSPMAEAQEWASWASPGEVRAYLVACFRRLPDVERRRFLGAAQRMALPR